MSLRNSFAPLAANLAGANIVVVADPTQPRVQIVLMRVMAVANNTGITLKWQSINKDGVTVTDLSGPMDINLKGGGQTDQVRVDGDDGLLAAKPGEDLAAFITGPGGAAVNGYLAYRLEQPQS